MAHEEMCKHELTGGVRTERVLITVIIAASEIDDDIGAKTLENVALSRYIVI